jgi:hypothetical protein
MIIEFFNLVKIDPKNLYLNQRLFLSIQTRPMDFSILQVYNPLLNEFQAELI